MAEWSSAVSLGARWDTKVGPFLDEETTWETPGYLIGS